MPASMLEVETTTKWKSRFPTVIDDTSRYQSTTFCDDLFADVADAFS